jgi:hypothetical protein
MFQEICIFIIVNEKRTHLILLPGSMQSRYLDIDIGASVYFGCTDFNVLISYRKNTRLLIIFSHAEFISAPHRTFTRAWSAICM